MIFDGVSGLSRKGRAGQRPAGSRRMRAASMIIDGSDREAGKIAPGCATGQAEANARAACRG